MLTAANDNSADPFLRDLFPTLPPDEAEQWIKIEAHKAQYLRDHPDRGRGKASKRPKSGDLTDEGKEPKSYAHYIEKGARLAGYTGFSETGVNRIIQRVTSLGAALLQQVINDKRRKERKRHGLGDFLDKLIALRIPKPRRWDYIDKWLEGLPPRIILASLAPIPLGAPRGSAIDLRLGNSKVEVPCYFENRDSADIIVTDPPYGLGGYSGHSGYSGRAGHRPIEGDEDAETIAGWSVPIMWQALKDGGTVYLFTCWQVEPVWRAALERAGFIIAEVLIWDKVHASGSGAATITTLSQHELIIVAHKGSVERQVWKDDYGLTSKPGRLIARDVSIWTHPVPKDRETREGHPTPKPPEVMMRALLNHSRPGDLVLDMFAGSGPVAVAARRLGRRYIGFEKDDAYYAVAMENLTDGVANAA